MQGCRARRSGEGGRGVGARDTALITRVTVPALQCTRPGSDPLNSQKNALFTFLMAGELGKKNACSAAYFRGGRGMGEGERG